MLTLALAALAPLSAPPLSGIARAGDGNSLTIGPTRVRLFGIDAPEFDQTCERKNERWLCGKASADQLSRLVTGRQVVCQNLGIDDHDRILGRCFVGTTEVNRAMVAAGYAVAFRRYSQDYVGVEASAKRAKLGIWSSTFDMPSEVRAATRGKDAPRRVAKVASQAAPAARRSSGVCDIKGNHSRRGEWIYHMPGMPYYGRTRPEAMFCSEAEAQAAGYRRARVR